MAPAGAEPPPPVDEDVDEAEAVTVIVDCEDDELLSEDDVGDVLGVVLPVVEGLSVNAGG